MPYLYVSLCIQGWQEEVLVYQEEVEGLSVLAQQVLDETHISSRVSTRATQLTARYHALILNIQVRQSLLTDLSDMNKMAMYVR